MFEDVCLTCGKHLYDDDQVYCSKDCQNVDTSSPSVSSASSAVSSPQLGFATGGDVPALVPSALGTALTSAAFHRRRHHYSVSSSSASSTSWSIMTDEDEDIDDSAGIGSYGSNYHSSVDSFHEGGPKSANALEFQKSSPGLFYTRRPSGINNNNSTLASLHNRNSSGNVPHVPRSAPLHFNMGIDDDVYSDVSFSSREDSDSEVPSPKQFSKNKKNRASLPGCFSLLQANPSEQKHTASQISSNGYAITTQRKTPPTPKLPLLNAISNLTLTSPASLTTPRGRRRVQGETSSSRRSGSSSSRSPSRSRWPATQLSPFRAREDSDAQLSGRFHEAPRGRATIRRNSSPPPKMTLSSYDRETFGARDLRGRQRVGDDANAPGYGHGRSGLLDRERALGGRTTRVL